MSTQKRKYEKKARAESQRETRERIAGAAAELHREVGVARTTVAEIARRAGVQRLTVYNHFPDLSCLLPACAAHYAERHPRPDLTRAFGHKVPADRVRAVLQAMYGWYGENEAMLAGIQGDRGAVPELEEFCRQNSDRELAELAAALAAGFGAQSHQGARVRALLALALDFWTWRRLDGEGLDTSAAAGLMAEAAASVNE